MMRAIKGGLKEGVAPCPKKGLSKAIFQTVEAIAGKASRREIRELLPAAVDDPSQIGAKRINNSLQYLVWAGYLVHHEPTDTFRVAPLSYYEARVAWRNDPNRKKYPRGEHHRKPVVPATHEIVVRHDWMISAAVGTITFLLGMFACAVVGGMQ